MKPFEWIDARTIDAALAAAREPESAFKAGGIDLLGLMKEGLAAPQRLVNLRGMQGLDAIEGDAARGVSIGPLVTLAKLAESEALRGAYGALAGAAGHAATPQIRNVATIGGNLLQRPRCWYFQSPEFHCLKKGGTTCFAIEGDHRYHAIFANGRCAIVHPSATAVPLVALGAELEILAAGGARSTLPIDRLFVAPDEDPHREHRLEPGQLIAAVRLPAAPKRRSAYVKQGEKESYDWPIADVAVALDLDDDGRCTAARVVLGAAAPVPWRAKDAESALAGARVDAERAAFAAKAAVQGATPLARNAYKLPIFEAIVRRAILAAAGA